MCLTVSGLQFLGFLKKNLEDEDKYEGLVEWYRQRKTQFLAKFLTLSYVMVKNTGTSLLYGDCSELSYEGRSIIYLPE
jgi:hypothetical protein